MGANHLSLELPAWVEGYLKDSIHLHHSVKGRMQLAIGLSAENAERGTGGPFGAAVFDAGTWELLAVGVNIVVPTHCSVAHAEMMAMMLAQQAVQHFDLSREGTRRTELVTSTEPCAMCLGAIPWAGIRQLVCGARQEDARRIGFEEGPRSTDWVRELSCLGISTQRDVCREEAAEVLSQYGRLGGIIYNGGGLA